MPLPVLCVWCSIDMISASIMRGREINRRCNIWNKTDTRKTLYFHTAYRSQWWFSSRKHRFGLLLMWRTRGDQWAYMHLHHHLLSLLLNKLIHWIILNIEKWNTVFTHQPFSSWYQLQPLLLHLLLLTRMSEQTASVGAPSYCICEPLSSGSDP